MKTNLFLLGMAVAAFSSCTNEEVTDVAQNRAIKFNQFVNNNTRTVVEVNKDNRCRTIMCLENPVMLKVHMIQKISITSFKQHRIIG